MYQKLGLKDLRSMDPTTRNKRYEEMVTKNRDSESWREIAQYVLRNQDRANQYTMLKTVLSLMKNKDRNLFRKISPTIDVMFEDCLTMGSVFVLAKYLLVVSDQSSNFLIETGYRVGIRKYGLFQRQIEQMNGMTHFDNQNPIFSQIESAVEVTPKLYSKCKLTFQLKTLKPFLSWLCIFRVRNYDYCVMLDDFCKFLVVSCANANKLSAGYDIEGISTLLLAVLGKCLQSYPNCHNLALILEQMSDLEVETAVLSYEMDFTKFSSGDFIRFATVLTKSSLGPNTVKLLIALSNVYKNSGMDSKLTDIFRGFIVHRVMGWGKVTQTAQKEVQQLAEFYVDGLLDRIPNKQECIGIVLADFNKVDPNSQFFWATLMYKIAYNNTQLSHKIKTETRLQNLITPQDYGRLKNMCWKQPSRSQLPTSDRSLGAPSKPVDVPSRIPQRQIQSFVEYSPVLQKKEMPSTDSSVFAPASRGPQRISHSVMNTPNRKNQYNVSTPVQQRLQIPSSASIEEGFLARSPQQNRKISSNDMRLHKTATRFSVDPNSNTLHRMQPPIKKSKDYKVTSNKLSLIPARSAGYNTNYAEMAIMFMFALQKLASVLEDVKDQITGNKDKFVLLNELLQIFSKMANLEGKTINLKQLMDNGPTEYKDQDKQFEICEYFNSIFSNIVAELDRIPARYGSAQKFKQLFEIVIKEEASCPSCKAPHQNFSNLYLLPHSRLEPLEVEWTDSKQLLCQKCQSTSLTPFTNKIISSPTLLMVQLLSQNRIKPPLPIPRRWNNSTLTGFVVIQSISNQKLGDYRFYYRNLKNPLTWLQFTFNYGQALQFRVQTQDEEFQANFNVCLTLYQRDQSQLSLI